MATAKISSRIETFLADKANTTYELAKGKLVATDDYGIDVAGAPAGRSLDIDGWVDADTAAIRIGTGAVDAAPVKLEIGGFGKLTSENVGVESHGDGHVIHNAGQVQAGLSGMALYGTHTVVNTGEIIGTANGLNIYSGDGGPTVIKNTGVIAGESRSIYGSASEEWVTNAGDLNGDVDLMGGDDRFVFKSGSVDGVVRGGIGDDSYIVHKAGLNLVEDIDEGFDRVRSTVSFTLQSNIEELTLLGKKNTDGLGNGSDNKLYGNAGKNSLDGATGFDYLDGGEGDDMLAGGTGADDFHFARGSGKDTITDYEASFDDILLDQSLKGVSDFQDMMANHVKDKGDDLWITYGDDIIVLKNTEAADLQAERFGFVD